MVAVILPWRQRESCCSVEEEGEVEGEATRAVRTHHLAVSARLARPSSSLAQPQRQPSPLIEEFLVE